MNELIDRILAALRAGHDGTIHALRFDTPQDGYMVGGVSWTMTARPEQVDSETIRTFIIGNWEILNERKMFIGWWTHDGRVYFDVSENISLPNYAAMLGRYRKEIAIWDVKNAKEISCQ